MQQVTGSFMRLLTNLTFIMGASPWLCVYHICTLIYVTTLKKKTKYLLLEMMFYYLLRCLFWDLIICEQITSPLVTKQPYMLLYVAVAWARHYCVHRLYASFAYYFLSVRKFFGVIDRYLF